MAQVVRAVLVALLLIAAPVGVAVVVWVLILECHPSERGWGTVVMALLNLILAGWIVTTLSSYAAKLREQQIPADEIRRRVLIGIGYLLSMGGIGLSLLFTHFGYPDEGLVAWSGIGAVGLSVIAATVLTRTQPGVQWH